VTAQLAATLAGLFRASRTDGRQRSRVLSKGLEVRVGTADGDVIYLSRKDGQASQDEAAIVAQAAGWVLFDTELESWNGTRYLLIRPSGSLEEDIEDLPLVREDPPPSPAPATGRDAAPDEEAEKALDARIRAVLLGDGPWQNPTFTPSMTSIRQGAIKDMKRQDLRDELAWIRRNWPDAAARAMGDVCMTGY
jgi:hypothetical protein